MKLSCYLQLFILLFITNFNVLAQQSLPQSVNYSGRIDFTKPGGPVMYYAGSYLHTSFEGTSLKAVFSDVKSKVPLKVQFVIDSTIVFIKEVPLGADHDTIDVVSGLPNTTHTLYIAKAEGPGTGSFGLQFNGFITDNGVELQVMPAPSLKIEVFGDSFTEGVGAGCVNSNGNCGENNGWYSYANILARKLNAQINNNGIGGLALLDSTGWYQSKTTGLQTTYNKLIPTNEAGNNYTPWDFSRYIPNLVIFAMGINDQYDPNKRAFSDTLRWQNIYKYIIQDVINHYGFDTKIIIAPGNICSEVSYKNSSSVARALKKQGYSVWYFNYSFNLNAHPNHAEHQKMADELYDYIIGQSILTDSNKNPIVQLNELYPDIYEEMNAR